jgi:CxxC motif-containing protein
MIKQLICIRCPLGCALRANIEDGVIISVSGNTCPRGADYAASECLNPKRMITSAIPVSNGQWEMLPLKSSCEVPKDKVQECVRCLRGLNVRAPVRAGQVILANVAGTGADFIATRSVAARPEAPARAQGGGAG